LDGVIYPSAQNAFEASKLPEQADREIFVSCPPNEARFKAEGLPTIPKHKWLAKRVSVMTDIQKAKFMTNPELKELLLATGQKQLINANHYGDAFWGTNEIGEGENVLGVILMEFRESLRPVEKKVEIAPVTPLFSAPKEKIEKKAKKFLKMF
jgi:ribA/ribD-fused uncharacterized protein